MLRFYLVVFFLEFNVTEYDYLTAIVAVVGGSTLAAIILWDLLQELKDGRR